MKPQIRFSKNPSATGWARRDFLKLSAAAKTFKVLILKTPLTKPYTSVFFQLQCGYWNAASELQLHDTMNGTK
jgi:hypothetical protein